ncbi:MAG: glycerol-3-phosphate 1-O-acyltransferase PlsY [Thermotogota bacterium]
MWFFSILISYLLGAIPFSYVIPKIIKNIDVRKNGSKNVGASNAVYTSGMKVGILCFLGDFFKGYFAHHLAIHYFELEPLVLILSSVAVVVGHNWNVFLKLKGGKGMATAWGVIFSSNYIAGILFFLYAATITFSTKYIAVGTVIGVFFVWITSFIPIFDFNSSLFFSLLLIILPKHIENVKKIINGTEYKINERMDR